MDWVTGIVTVTATLGSLIIAGLSLYFSYRDRRASHRQFLYEQQAQAAQAIAQKLREIHVQLVDLTVLEYNTVVSDATRAELVDLIDGSMNEWVLAIYPHQLLLPAFVDDAVSHFFDTVADLIDRKNPTTMEQIADAFHFALDELRRSLGVEPLSTETLRLLGAPTQTQRRSTTPTATSSIKVKWKGRINPAAPDT